jgi:hypothetical protein
MKWMLASVAEVAALKTVGFHLCRVNVFFKRKNHQG